MKGPIMYITFYKTLKTPTPIKKEMTIEDYFFKTEDVFSTEEPIETVTGRIVTVEKTKEEISNFFENHVDPRWIDIPQPPSWPISEIHAHYTSFNIPKKTGGLRHIDAPDDELKLYLTKLKYYFEDTLKILTHDAAHAYVKQRSTVTCVQQHQKNESKWFLKLDLKDFFPSHNLEYVMYCLEQIYPIGNIIDTFPSYKANLRKALEYAFLDDVLPQGTPLSPTLTNICMTPLDYKIQHTMWDKKSHFVYTRYADDMIISSPYKFDYRDIESAIESILTAFGAPFRIKTEKTRFGSSAGRNWNLGIMLNKDNRMTIGHKQNQRFRATLHNLILDYKNGIEWPAHDKMVFQGDISYYKAIDPDYTNHVLREYEDKYNVSIKDILKT